MEPAQSPEPAGAPLAGSRASLRDRRERPHLAPQLAPGMLRPADHAARIERFRLWSDGERTTNHNSGQSSPQNCERSSDSSSNFSAGHHQRRYPDFNACFNACFNTQELSAHQWLIQSVPFVKRESVNRCPSITSSLSGSLKIQRKQTLLGIWLGFANRVICRWRIQS